MIKTDGAVTVWWRPTKMPREDKPHSTIAIKTTFTAASTVAIASAARRKTWQRD